MIYGNTEDGTAAGSTFADHWIVYDTYTSRPGPVVIFAESDFSRYEIKSSGAKRPATFARGSGQYLALKRSFFDNFTDPVIVRASPRKRWRTASTRRRRP